MRLPAAALLVAFVPALALAHPLDEVTQGAYLTLAPGEVRLELDITPGALVSASVLSALDADGDRHITDAEARAYAGQVLAQSTLTLDGAPARWRLDHVSVPPYENLLGEALPITLYAVAPRPPRPGKRTLAYDNAYAPAKTQRMANVFLRQAGGWRYQVTDQQRAGEGRALTVRYTVSR